MNGSLNDTPGDVIAGKARWSLVCGRWEDALADIEVDAVITDPPYSEQVHNGHNRADEFRHDGGDRVLSYGHWTEADVNAFVDSWAPRCRGWMVCISDYQLGGVYRAAYERNGFYGFAPVVAYIPGMTVRLAGDGPSSWALYVNVGRPRSLSKWGTTAGGYTGPPGERIHIGGKPLWLMQKLVCDYTRRGDVVCDPCAGAATTIVAAIQCNRRAIGSESDPETYSLGRERMFNGGSGHTAMFDLIAPKDHSNSQLDLLTGSEPR